MVSKMWGYHIINAQRNPVLKMQKPWEDKNDPRH